MSPDAPLAQPSAPLLEVRAELDVPGETRRQARVFGVWLLCLGAAVLLAISARPRSERPGMPPSEEEVSRSRMERVRVAAAVGLFLPGVLTLLVTRWHRRGGGHARGIYVDLTADGELRIWGRGYGSRIRLQSVELDEVLVDAFTGRLGAWRQRRIRLRTRKAPERGYVTDMQLATRAVAEDGNEGLRVEGGEGDCIELARADYERVRDAILRASGKTAASSNDAAG